MELEPGLVIIPYPDRFTTKTSRPFSKDCSMLFNTTRVQMYVDELFAVERKTTTVKLLVGHDTPSAAFNSLEFAWKADEFDGEFCVCTIQASKVVTAGYLLGSIKMMDDIHWSDHYNNHPRLLRMNVQVKTKMSLIPLENRGAQRIKSMLLIFSAREKNENNVNIQMGGMYKKERKRLVQ